MNKSGGDLTKIDEALQQSLEITEVRVRQSQVKTKDQRLQPGKTALLEALCLVITYQISQDLKIMIAGDNLCPQPLLSALTREER